MSQTIELKLDEESFKKLAAESILAQLSDTERNSILSQAVRYLLEPKEQGYGRRYTPLQEAFAQAINSIAHDVARKVLNDMPEVQEKVKEVVVEAYERALVTERESTVTQLSIAIVEAMRCHR